MANKLIFDNFGNLDIIEIINDKIKINKIIEEIECVSINLKNIFNNILNEYIPKINNIKKLVEIEFGEILN